MTGHYKKPAEAGKIYPCKVCGRTPSVGEDRYYEKQGDNWLGCVDFECFKKQGGSPEPASKSGGGKFTPNKHSISKATEIYNLAEGLLDSFYKKRQGEIKAENVTLSKMPLEQEAIFIESTFRTLSGNFKP